MSIRRSAWEELHENGFRHQLPGRQGSALTSGEDIELMYAFRMAGWTLWHDPALFIQHFVPAGRLQWDYMRRLRRGGGAATVGLDPYSFALLGVHPSFKECLRQTWSWQLARALRSLAQCRLKTLFLPETAREGNSDVLEVEHLKGRIGELWRGRRLYARRVHEIRELAQAWNSASANRPAPVTRPEGAVEPAVSA
jgi:hypothetical protein